MQPCEVSATSRGYGFQIMTSPTENPPVSHGRVVTLSRDVFFGMRVRTILRQLGHDLVLAKTEDEAVTAVSQEITDLVLVDFNQPVAWESLQPVLAGDTPVLAFGSHTDVEGFRAAKAAGVSRVVSNGEFSRRLPELLEQYRR
jgi:CheY-like chemotaxis protein